jgi:hypothetical protein
MGIVLNGGYLGPAQVVSAGFRENFFPVRATEFIRSQHIHNHLFSTDAWSGYLIYRLYPETKLYIDDRHDFYGADYIQEFVRARQAHWTWRQVLDKYQIQWVLIPTDIPLAGVLKESRDWRVEFDDGMAIVFSRRGPSQQDKPKSAGFPADSPAALGYRLVTLVFGGSAFFYDRQSISHILRCSYEGNWI